MKTLILIATLLLTGCTTIDAIFGPPFSSMSQQDIDAFCLRWPSDNMCKRLAAGEFKGGYPK